MSEPFVGQLALFPYNFAPVNWVACQGQLLPIAQHTALFSAFDACGLTLPKAA